MTSEDDDAELNRMLREFERSLLGSENNTSEEQDDMIESVQSANHNKNKLSPERSGISGANRKRKGKPVSNNFSEEKGKSTKKGRRSDTGQSSGSQQPEPEGKELIKTNQKIKNINDALYRRAKNDKMEEKDSLLWLMHFAMANKILDPQARLVDFLNQIKWQWPERSDVQSIREKVAAIQNADDMEETEKMQKLVKIRLEVENLNKKRLGVNQSKRQCSERFDLENIKEILDAAPMEVPDMMQRFVDIGEEIRRLDEQGLEVYQIKRQCSERFDLENVEGDMEEMQDTTEARREETEKKEKGFEDVRKENQGLKEELRRQSEEMDKKLEDLRKKNQRLKEKRRKGFQVSTEVNDVIKILISEVGNVETSRAKPPSAFQDNASNGPTAVQGQGSLQTCEELQYIVKDFYDLKNEVFAKDNNKVDVLQFPNLKEAIKIASRIVPDYLQPIASKIQNDRGTPTEFELINIQLLVCAVIKEMEDLPLQPLNSCKLLKWGGTLNRAKELGFQVKFADTLLEKKLHSSFVCSKIG